MDVAFKEGSAFWRFSLGVYGPETSAACVALQDASGVDVNVLLYLLWRGTQGDCFDRDDVAAIDDLVRGWRAHVVEPLRSVRRWMKTEADAFPAETRDGVRSGVKKQELMAEKIEQEFLFTEAAAIQGSPANIEDAMKRNAEAYADYLGTSFASAHLAVLMNASTAYSG